MTRILLVSEDEVLLEHVRRLAAVAGVDPVQRSDPGALHAGRESESLIVVGLDRLEACAAAGYRRRRGVIVLAGAEPPQEVWQRAVQIGAEQVVVLPEGEENLIRRFGDAAAAASDRGRVLCCIGGRGGAGSSILAAALALTAARRPGPAPVLVDVDPCGGGLDVLLGAEESPGLRWPDLGNAVGRFRSDALRDALPQVGGAAVLAPARDSASDLDPQAVRTVVDAAAGESGTVIADLPRILTPAAREAVIGADRVLVVVPADVRSCVAAADVARRLGTVTDRAAVVVRSDLQARLPAGVVAATLGLPLAGSFRSQPSLPASLDRGELPSRRLRGGLRSLCTALLDGPETAPVAAA